MSMVRNLFGNNYQSGSLGNIFSGLFGDAGSPYKEASRALDKYLPQAQQYQQPFYQAGIQSIPQYQNFLNRMQDPSKFINDLMGQYHESPYAQYQQQQARRAAENYGSATGLTGSTPLMQQAQQNANNISSGDINQWLNNVLGINTQYGQGQQNIIQSGQNAGNILTQLMNEIMQNKAALGYGQESADQGQFGQLIGGLAGLFGL